MNEQDMATEIEHLADQIDGLVEALSLCFGLLSGTIDINNDDLVVDAIIKSREALAIAGDNGNVS